MAFTFPVAFFYGIYGTSGSAIRATSDATTGTSPGTPVNPTYAYDTTGTTVDTSTGTSCTLTTSGNKITVQTFSFASGTATGTLHINMSKVVTLNSVSSDLANDVSSTVDVYYSTDGGTNWTWINGWSGGTGATDYDCTAALSSQNMANLRVRVTAQSFSIGIGVSHAAAYVTYWVSDVVVL